MKKVRFRFGSVYSGGGFGSKGATMAGGTETFAVDLNPVAKKVFQLNFPDVPFLSMNALNITLENLMQKGIISSDAKNLDILVMSPPCTGISRANPYRHPFLPVNSLLLDCPRLIAELNPKVAIIENVQGLCDPVMLPLLNLLLSRCKKLKDYTFEYRVLNALDYGVPQNRKRFVLILVRKDVGTPVFPEPTTKDYAALNLNNVFPNIIGYDPGGPRKKVKPIGSNMIIGKANKFVHACQPVGTMTSTGGTRVMDLETGIRPINRNELITFTGAESMDFTDITDNELGFVAGNGIMPKFMQSICNRIAEEFFD